MKHSRMPTPKFTSTSPSPTLADLEDRPGLKETKATTRRTTSELKALGPVIDPKGYTENKDLAHWVWISNQHSTADVYSDAEREIKKVETGYLWKLLKHGIVHLVEEDFDPIVPPPAGVKRVAFIHDMGFLIGMYYYPQESSSSSDSKSPPQESSSSSSSDSKSPDSNSNKNPRFFGARETLTERALLMLADMKEISRLGTGAIINGANSRFPKAPGRSCEKETLEVEFVTESPLEAGRTMRIPGQFFALDTNSFQKTATLWVDYRLALESAIGKEVFMIFSGYIA